MTHPLTRHTAAAHEALYPQLERLTRHVEAMAVRRPAAPVPAAALAIATDLLFEAQGAPWNPDLKCFAWLLPDPVPVKRLRPEAAVRVRTQHQSRAVETLRRKIAERIEELSART